MNTNQKAAKPALGWVDVLFDRCKMNRILFSYLCAAGLLISPSASVVDDLPSPRDLIQAANEISNLSKIRPYILTATLVLQPGKKNQAIGKVTIYRDKEAYRSELEMGGYRQLGWTTSGKLRIARSSAYPLPGLENLTELDRFLELRFPAETSYEKLSKTTRNGVEAYCFEARQPGDRWGSQECFDAKMKTAIQGSITARAVSERRVVWFSDFHDFSGRQFPGNIRFSQDKRDTPLEVRDIEIKPGQLNLANMPVAKEFLEFDTCEDMKPARLVKRVDPSYPIEAKLGHISGDVTIYSIIGADGTLRDLKVLESPHPSLAEESIRVVKQWLYTPPMCGSVRVSAENGIKIRFHMQ